MTPLKSHLFESLRRLLAKRGFYVVRRRYDLPIPDENELGPSFWSSESELVGIHLNEQHALAFARDVLPRYNAEFREKFPLHPSPGHRFHLINGTFMAVDAHVYYALVRHLEPRRIVEIGAGYSTLVACQAARRNEELLGYRPEITAIDPYPPDFLAGEPGLSRVLPRRVQEVDLDLFTSLSAGDVLFIDSSHVLRSGGDVQFEYCEVLPRLAEGVVVHVHDVSLPAPYPRVYFESELYWNEQYVLQAFLAFNSKFDVFWPAAYMTLRHHDLVVRMFPEYREMRAKFPQSNPSSFWMRVAA